MNVGLLLQYIEHFPGVCIVVTNLKAAIDEAFFYRFGFVVEFEKPDTPLREQFWALMLPKECPLAPDVSIPVLARSYEMVGGDIKSAVVCAASCVALRDKEDRIVKMTDLEVSCKEEMWKMNVRTTSAFKMYP